MNPRNTFTCPHGFAYTVAVKNYMGESSLALIGNASGRPRSQTLLPQLLPRGIFDKETRRKALAVVGAAMELGSPIDLHGCAKEAGRAGLDKTGRPIYQSATSDFVNWMREGIGEEFASSL